jgi:hypothetical protein
MLQKFIYLGMTIINHNCIHKEIKSRLKLGNPLQNPTLGILVMEEVTSFDGEQGSGPPKPRCEAPC